MSKSLLLSFIKYSLFRKRPYRGYALYLLFSILIVVAILTISYGSTNNVPDIVLTICWAILVMMFIYIAIDAFSEFYNSYRKYHVDKPEPAEKYKDTASKIDPTTRLYLKQLDQRITNIEQNFSPLRLTLITFFMCIGITVTILLLIYMLLPH